MIAHIKPSQGQSCTLLTLCSPVPPRRSAIGPAERQHDLRRCLLARLVHVALGEDTIYLSFVLPMLVRYVSLLGNSSLVNPS
jgi:hypothetical protein